MRFQIGIRREDKNRWERRVPLVSEDVRELRQKQAIEVVIQPSKIRVFSDDEYSYSGAQVQEDLSSCSVIFAIKEIPLNLIQRDKTYVFFSHTIKGQPHNMPMLKKIIELKSSLIDYEKVVDEHGRRLIFFGEYAGMAGMIDTLWALGQRLNQEGILSPFYKISQAHSYHNLTEVKEKITEAGRSIAQEGLPQGLFPLLCGLTGYGNVSRGAQAILDLLPVKEIDPEEIISVFEKPDQTENVIYKIVFKEEHTVEPISPSDRFQLQDYYEHPEKYRSQFHTYLTYLTILVNCIYWEKRYPRLVTKEDLRRLYTEQPQPRLRVIGDISCDIDGAIECTTHATDPDQPLFVYNPFTGQTTAGFAGRGPVVMAIDNLPCELPRESSTYFSRVLKDFVPEIVQADFSRDFDHCNLSPTIKNAVIVYRGQLTPNYTYLNKFL